MTTAVLVIDVQNGFNEPEWGARNNPDAETNIAALARAWQDARDPLVLVRHDSLKADSPLRPGQPGNDLQPLLGEIRPTLLFGKDVNSAFLGDGATLTADQLATATAANLHGGGFARVTTTKQVLADRA
ncbi:MAG TPA: isochorismatase family protein [Jatrophihabitantaceae bacterium]|jgi:nicotinamidase-related amidase